MSLFALYSRQQIVSIISVIRFESKEVNKNFFTDTKMTHLKFFMAHRFN